MNWVQWDSENGRLLSVVNVLPDDLVNASVRDRIARGYHELVVEWPDDRIERFTDLLGSAQFALLADGRVKQWYPNADFSVAAVRRSLSDEVKKSARQLFYRTDWYLIRELETGQPVPDDVKIVRQKQRAHENWLQEKIESLPESELVAFQWYWPQRPEETMLDGIPTIFVSTTPATSPTAESLSMQPEQLGPRARPNVLPEPVAPADQVPADGLQGKGPIESVIASDSPIEMAPPPLTTDGPVEHYDLTKTLPPAADGRSRPTR